MAVVAAAGGTMIVDADPQEEASTMSAIVLPSEAALPTAVAGGATEMIATGEIAIPRTRTACLIENPVTSASCYRRELETSPWRDLSKLPANPRLRPQRTCLRLPSHHPPRPSAPSRPDSPRMPTSNHSQAKRPLPGREP